MRQALLLVLAVVITSTLVGAARFIWLDIAYDVIEPMNQRVASLAGTVAFLIGGGLLAATVTWSAHGEASAAPPAVWKRDLADSALGNAVAAIPGAWVLYVMIWDLSQAALALGALVLVGTSLFWVVFRIDNAPHRTSARN